MLVCDWPIGTPAERAAAVDRLPGSWFDANPYMSVYKIGGQGNNTLHTGADLNNNSPTWNSDYHSPVYSIADGVVMFAGPGGGSWGHIIVIKHDGCYSRYGHIEKTIVKVGDRVVMGQQIANVGSGDGYYAGYEHLHFDISTTDILARQPNEWPNMNEALLRANYVAPILFIIAHKSAQPAPESEPAVTTQKYYVTQAGNGLRLRKWYGTSEGIIASLNAGVAVDGYDLTVIHPDLTWRLVGYNGQIGWVADKFIALTPP
jgi:murein DD-endopeptidase MepM/ murein hydrolase activator NlpD